MATRIKVTCTAVGKTGNGQNHVAFAPVPAGSAENEQVYLSTPGGSMSMITVTDSVMSRYEPGKHYYIDISPAGAETDNVDKADLSNPAGVAPRENLVDNDNKTLDTQRAQEVNKMNPVENPATRNLTNEVKP